MGGWCRSWASALREHFGPADCPATTATAVGACSYRCPAATVLKPRPGFQSGSNGCGSGMATLPARTLPPGMTKFCDAHDACYDVCGKSKAACDEEFMDCLEHKCAAQTDLIHTDLPGLCIAAGRALMFAVDAFGCPVYLARQGSACHCVMP